jgi:hypothetical protein
MASSSSPEQSSKLPTSGSPSVQPGPKGDTSEDLSTTFAVSLEAKDKASCIELLDGNFDALTKPGCPFEWLKDPVAIGLTSTEIVSLLSEESEQSPWISYHPNSVQVILHSEFGYSVVERIKVEVK